MDLKGHAALVTGAGRRLGLAFALALVERGARVAVHYRSSSDGAKQVLKRAEQLGVKAAALQADLADPDQCEALTARAYDALGVPVDWLVNNASVFDNVDAPDTTLEVWNRNIMVNCTAAFILSRDVCARLRDAGADGAAARGAIVNMLDYRALQPGPDHFAYTIGKAGLAAMTKSMAQEYAPAIRVNGLALGNILPPVDGTEDGKTPTFRRTPAKRRGTTDEVVDSLLFLLAGPQFVTGHILYVDGGRSLT